MHFSETALGADWLGLCRRSVRGLAAMLVEHPTTLERARGTGRGAGGDEAVFIDRAAEEIIFAELDALHAEGHRFTVVSEERGHVDYGDPTVRVVIDPIDGSLNAKRGLSHHAVSIAVASGPTMADVDFGFVYDFGPDEEWSAARGGGAFLDGRPLPAAPAERRNAAGRLEIVAIESAHPRHIARVSEELGVVAHRVRALGTMAVSMCQVVNTRVDGMATLWRCRAVDVAAAQLIVRESGGLVCFTACEAPLGAPLDLVAHSPVVAARSPRALAELRLLSGSSE